MSRKEPTTLPRNGSSGPCRRRHGDARVRSTPKARPPAACSPLPSRCALESPAPFPATLSVPRTVSAAPATAWPRPQLSATPLAPDAICNRFLPGPKFMKTVGPKDLTTLTAPATVETWVSDAAGDPVLVVMAAPGASLAMELRRLLPDLRRAVGDQRRVLVGFDRGGWSPKLFAYMDATGFDVLTWVRASPRTSAPTCESDRSVSLDAAWRFPPGQTC